MLKKTLAAAVIVLAVFIAAIVAIAHEIRQGAGYTKMDLPVKRFLALPSEEAKSVYDFPVNIRITGRTEDRKWYKIKLSYNFIGYFEYEGWVKVE